MFRMICSTARTRNYSYSLISAAALFFLSLIVFPQLLPNASFAEPASVTPSLTIGNSGTLAFSVNPGQFNSGNQTITVETTNYTGYTLTIAPASGTSTDLVNSTTNTTIPSVASNTKQSAFSSASYGFTIDSTITSNTEYKPVTNGATIKQTGSAGTDSICLTIGAKAESNTAAGVYQKQFTLTATANAVAYAITYNANAGTDTVTNMPTSPQTSGSVSGTDLTLASEVPERTGYTFLGWSTNSSATTATYSAGDSYSLDQTTGNRITLYAIWKINTHTLTISLGTGVSSVTIDGTAYHNGDTVSLEENTTHNINMTFASGYEFDSWSVSGTGSSVVSTSTQSTTFTMGTADTTLTANGKISATQCDNTKLCIQYNGNGLNFASTGSIGTNNVNYNSTTTQTEMTKYSHTSNISDDGTQNGNYPSYADTNEVITIPGATSLMIELTYAGESAYYDWVSLWSGGHPDYTAASNYDAQEKINLGSVTNNRYGGGSGTTVSGTISGDTVTFAFKSDGSGVGNGYGYYAVITGTSIVNTRTLASGTYETPSTTSSQLFHGWSTNSSAKFPSEVEYTDESEVKSKLPGNEGESVTVYAVWQQGHNITFNLDSNVTSLAIFDSEGSTVSTVTPSNAQALLYEGNTYTIKPTHTTGYTTDTITKTSGSGTLSGKSFTVDGGTATINVTSKPVPPLQGFDCAILAVGESTQAYDTRDNQVYTVSKYKMSADGSQTACWMSNLNLGAEALTVSELNSSNSNMPSATAISKSTFEGWIKSSGSASYTSPELIPVSGQDSYGNKYGTLYNYAAASANTINAASGANNDDTSNSLCPAGWRLPTGGSSGEFQAFYNANSPTGTTMQSDYGFSIAGYFYNSTPDSQGSFGRYWSSTRLNGYVMYVLYCDSSLVDPANNNGRSGGNPVRCISL